MVKCYLVTFFNSKTRLVRARLVRRVAEDRGAQPLLEAGDRGLRGLCTDEGALSFVATICSAYRGSPYKLLL